jgi:N-acetylglutamate synthase/N-acetylornithine aminotransferase
MNLTSTCTELQGMFLVNGAGFTIDEENSRDAYEIFKRELSDFAADLQVAKLVDGEGATKFVTRVTVTVKVNYIRVFSSRCSFLQRCSQRCFADIHIGLG